MLGVKCAGIKRRSSVRKLALGLLAFLAPIANAHALDGWWRFYAFAGPSEEHVVYQRGTMECRLQFRRNEVIQEHCHEGPGETWVSTRFFRYYEWNVRQSGLVVFNADDGSNLQGMLNRRRDMIQGVGWFQYWPFAGSVIWNMIKEAD